MRWWCQLAELMCGLAWRARGWHVQIKPEGADGPAHWLVALPAGSAEVRPMQALSMAQGALDELANGRSVVDAERLQELTRALDGQDGADPIVRSARALERVAWDRGITLESVYSTTNQLLNAVEAMAAEFESSGPQPQARHYTGPLSTMPIPAPITPARGEAKTFSRARGGDQLPPSRDQEFVLVNRHAIRFCWPSYTQAGIRRGAATILTLPRARARA